MERSGRPEHSADSSNAIQEPCTARTRLPDDRVLVAVVDHAWAPAAGRLLPVPAIVQGFILTTLAFESAVEIFGDQNEGASFAFVFLLITCAAWSVVLIRKLQDGGQDSACIRTQQKDSGGTPEREDSSDAIREGCKRRHTSVRMSCRF
ncbi:hypothetical protein L227DRAFT_616106 [Lentinus tigrinus ALCF2SS1-6]|uniref:Uncharacterized protein n=1 Tax=Lentinus tigrinus ALCF2SS1-6 TaxID=1328759 RepID=A0A5C2RVB1_9APHY|nr:hypothetical protein L227DRAFT_616106 [Lentinus tigrinus ALCF2SS1-6]